MCLPICHPKRRSDFAWRGRLQNPETYRDKEVEGCRCCSGKQHRGGTVTMAQFSTKVSDPILSFAVDIHRSVSAPKRDAAMQRHRGKVVGHESVSRLIEEGLIMIIMIS